MTATTRYVIILITAFYVVLTIAKAFYYSDKYGGTDLRCRVVGARLLTTNHSPYFYKWTAGESERLLDPNASAARLVNGNVVTPAVLYIIYPLSILTYVSIRWIWTLFEILAALGTIWLVVNAIKRKGNGERQLFEVLVAVLGLFCSEVFFAHTERGQMYVFFAFGFALSYYLTQASFRHSEFLGGVVAGLMVFVRPYAAVLCIGFLIKKNLRWLYGFGFAIILGLVLFVAPRPSLWVEYFEAMKEYNREVLAYGQTVNEGITPAKNVVPATIEGMDNLEDYRGFNVAGLSPLHFSFRSLGVSFNNLHAVILYGSLLAFFSFLFYKRGGHLKDALYLFGFLLYIFAELSFVTPRAGYNIIQWMVPVLLFYRSIKTSTPLLLCLFFVLALIHGFPVALPHQTAFAEFGLIVLLIIAFIRATKPRSSASPEQIVEGARL